MGMGASGRNAIATTCRLLTSTLLRRGRAQAFSGTQSGIELVQGPNSEGESSCSYVHLVCVF